MWIWLFLFVYFYVYILLLEFNFKLELVKLFVFSFVYEVIIRFRGFGVFFGEKDLMNGDYLFFEVYINFFLRSNFFEVFQSDIENDF